MKVKQRPFTSNDYMWTGVSAMFFSSCLTVFHSHNTLQLIFDLQDHFKFRTKNGEWGTYKNLIIKENVIHQLNTTDSVQLLIYLDVETEAAQAIKKRYLINNEIHAPDVDIFEFVNVDKLEKSLINSDPSLLETLIQKILQKLSSDAPRTIIDDRIGIAKKIIISSDPYLLSINFVAEKIHLSESRLRALFKKETGISLHKYILWHKIKCATNRIMAGASVVEAANEAGFSDSSHFHKMMIKMFGISPSHFMKGNKRMNVIVCDSSPLYFETKTYDTTQWVVDKIYK